MNKETPKSQKSCSSDSCISLLPDDPASTNAGHNRHDNSMNADEGYPEYPAEYKKTALAIMLTTCSTMFCGIVAAFVNDFVPRTPMPDLIFQAFPEQIWAWQVADTITLCLLSVNIIFTLLNKHRWIIARRYCAIASQLYFLRGVCMAVTWIAVPGKYHASRCIAPADPDRYWSVMFDRITQFMLSLGLSAERGGNHHLCGDLIYSGHTLVLTLSWFNIDLHVPVKQCRLLRLLACSCTMVGMVMIILCRMHYTVDVVLAFAITTMYFMLYHLAIVKYQAYQDAYWRRYLFLVFWLLPFIEFFERNVPKNAPFPRILEWPLTRPMFIRQFVKKLNDRPNYDSY